MTHTYLPIDPQQILHVQPDTFIKLIERGRARRRADGVVLIRERDHQFAGMALQISDKVAPNGLYRRMVRAEGGGVIFIFAGSV